MGRQREVKTDGGENKKDGSLGGGDQGEFISTTIRSIPKAKTPSPHGLNQRGFCLFANTVLPETIN